MRRSENDDLSAEELGEPLVILVTNFVTLAFPGVNQLSFHFLDRNSELMREASRCLISMRLDNSNDEVLLLGGSILLDILA